MKKIYICACASRTFISLEKIADLAAAAEAAGWWVVMINDLCEMAEDKVCQITDFQDSIVAACHERAVKSLLDFCGTNCKQSLNMRIKDTDTLLKEIGIDADNLDKNKVEELKAKFMDKLHNMPHKSGEDAWYPTIDKDVCAECGKCFDFCPFGVYEMVNDRVRVVHPHNCKNNCPACARTCPASAIIFPKYDYSPINGGAVKEENAVQLDTKTIYSTALKERLAARRNKFLKK